MQYFAIADLILFFLDDIFHPIFNQRIDLSFCRKIFLIRLYPGFKFEIKVINSSFRIVNEFILKN